MSTPVNRKRKYVKWLTKLIDFYWYYRNKLGIIWCLILVKMHVARYNFSPVKVSRSS